MSKHVRPRKHNSSLTLARELAKKAAHIHSLIAKKHKQRTISAYQTKVFRCFQRLHKTSTASTTNPNTWDVFVDTYAQTITNVLLLSKWIAQLRDLPFSLANIPELIPHTTQQIRSFILEIGRIPPQTPLYDAIADVVSFLSPLDVQSIVGRKSDDIILFYEKFLSAYHKEHKNEHGVYYTPIEIVDFMVRGIDEQLQQDFGLLLGVASTQSWQEVVAFQQTKKHNQSLSLPLHIRPTDCFLCFLDPATGTGTFLTSLIKQIRNNLIHHWQSIGWSKDDMIHEWTAFVGGTKGTKNDYSQHGLLQRMYAYEILPTPYIMTHLHMGLILEEHEIPYCIQPTDQLSLFWGDALEHHDPTIAKVPPYTVILGNPPYNGISSNNSNWMTEQINAYKYIQGIYFEEKKHWLHDDYVRFIRLGEYLIEKNTIGILSYINPHGFLYNPTFRGMRWHLLTSFDSLHIIDLHGNTRRLETTNKNSIDENVFLIQQGVCIHFLQKNSSSKDRGELYHTDIYGTKEYKCQYLQSNTIHSLSWQKLSTEMYSSEFPFYFFVPQAFHDLSTYLAGFRLDTLFHKYTTGIVTARDGLVIDIDKDKLTSKISRFFDSTIPDEHIRKEFFGHRPPRTYEAGDTRTWKLSVQRKRPPDDIEKHIQRVSYRPFDNRWIYFSRNMVDWPREEVMNNFIHGENIGLMLSKQVNAFDSYQHVFLTDKIAESCLVSNKTGEISYCFPLLLIDGQENTSSNLNQEIRIQFSDRLGIEVSDLSILHYVYAILHSPQYRRTYFDQLKNMFPYIPFPKNKDAWALLISHGKELQQAHLLQGDRFQNPPFALHNKNGTRENKSLPLSKSKFSPSEQKLWINEHQYISHVSENIWNTSVGAYKPAQKWLKDRKGISLTEDALAHYKKILVSLYETNKIMNALAEMDVC